MILQFSRLAICAAVLAANQARAACMICDELITIDEVHATCFLENFDQINEVIAADPKGRSSIDLAKCVINGEELLMRSGLATLPELGTINPTKSMKSVYMLDTSAVTCLRDLIEAHERPLDPAVVFDLFEACPG